MRWCWIIFLIFLVSCVEAPLEPIIKLEPEREAEPKVIPKEVIEIKESVYEPLELSLTTKNEVGILELDTKAFCSAKGGKKPYVYYWELDDKKVDCEEVCEFFLKEIKEYELSCTVTDNKQDTINKSISLKITKKPVDIEHVITFGDSLTYGHGLPDPETQRWPYLYSQKLNAETHNYAIPGATSYSVKDYQLEEFKKKQIEGKKLVFLWVGANDLKHLTSAEKFEENYRDIIKELLNIPDAKIILINIPDISELTVATTVEEGVNELLQGIGFNAELQVRKIGKDIITFYNQIIARIGKEYNLNVVDIFTHLQGFDNFLISEDLFHPNKEGHIEMENKIEEDLTKFYPKTEFH